jgi:hypothetical protein
MQQAEEQKTGIWLRIAVVAVLVPAIFAAVDDYLLRSVTHTMPTAMHLALVLGVFVAQIGLLGILAGKLILWPWLRWTVYAWCWVLLGLQAWTAGSMTQLQGSWWNPASLITVSLFAAQWGLVIIWGVLGTTRWTIRLPVSLAIGGLLFIPIAEPTPYYGHDVRPMLIVQLIALAAICGVLRWRRFRLDWEKEESEPEVAGTLEASAIEDAGGVPRRAAGRRKLNRTQFGVRDVLIWTTSLAFALGILRALDLLSIPGLSWLIGSQFVGHISSGLLIAIVLVVAVWGALGEGAWWLRIAVLLPVCGLSGFVLRIMIYYAQWREENMAATRWGGNYPFSLSVAFERNEWAMYWIPLAGGLVFASLLIFRTLGYRLLRAKRADQADQTAPLPSPFATQTA